MVRWKKKCVEMDLAVFLNRRGRAPVPGVTTIIFFEFFEKKIKFLKKRHA